MTAFSSAIDDACELRAAALGRDLHADEIEEIEDRLFQSWVSAARFAELVSYACDEFELQDGEAFCASLGSALCKAQESALAKELFHGLARAREAAFWRVWPNAQAGHVGAMKEAAVHLANAMKAYAEWYRCHASLGDEPGKRAVQAEMQRLQSRTRGEH